MAVFSDHVIIITGASEGIGRALAKALAPQGPKLVLAARNAARLDELKTEVEGMGAQALAVPTDVTDEAACKALVDRAVEAYGGVDVLVNNAGGTMWTLFEDVTDITIFERLMGLNYLGSVYCTKLWWLSSQSSSMRRPVCRKTSTVAQAQNAWCSSNVRSRRSAVSGSSAQVLAAPSGRARRVPMYSPFWRTDHSHRAGPTKPRPTTARR